METLPDIYLTNYHAILETLAELKKYRIFSESGLRGELLENEP